MSWSAGLLHTVDIWHSYLFCYQVTSPLIITRSGIDVLSPFPVQHWQNGLNWWDCIEWLLNFGRVSPQQGTMCTFDIEILTECYK
jgi:hypothetical protein